VKGCHLLSRWRFQSLMASAVVWVESGAFTRLRRAIHLQSEAFTRLRRASHSRSRAFTRLRRANHFLLLAQEKGNQREGHPGIRAGRTSFVLFPAVLVVHRPANNSAIPGLRQFAFPRWPTPLLGATAGEGGPERQHALRAQGLGRLQPSLPLRSGGSCPAGLKGALFRR
jgi:hypothetical protein